MAAPDLTRALAYALSGNRLLFGTRFLLTPGAAGPSWIGPRAARRPATRLFARGLGARDVGLGAGAIAALAGGRDGEAARWMAAHAISDAADLAATAIAADDLPAGPARIALAVAGVSTAIALWSAAGLGRRAAAPAPHGT